MKDPTDTRDIGPRVGSPLWMYLAAVTLVGAAVFGLAMSTELRGLSLLVRHPLFWVVAAMVVLGDIWPIVTPGKSSSEAPRASVTFSFAALIVWGLPVALLLEVSSTMLTFLGKRKAPHRAAFNAAASALGMAAAWAVLYLTGDRHSPLDPWMPGGADVQVILEPTRNAWVPLAAWLKARGAEVVMVAPENSADLRDY